MLPFSHYRDPKLGLASMLAQHHQKGDAQSEKLFQGLADSVFTALGCSTGAGAGCLGAGPRRLSWFGTVLTSAAGGYSP